MCVTVKRKKTKRSLCVICKNERKHKYAKTLILQVNKKTVKTKLRYSEEIILNCSKKFD